MSVCLFCVDLRKLAVEDHIRATRSERDIHFSTEEDAVRENSGSAGFKNK
jgi:hypothetical protein